MDILIDNTWVLQWISRLKVATFGTLLLCLLVPAQGQSQRTATSEQLSYFDAIFGIIAGPDEKREDAERRQAAFAAKLSLNSAERQALAKSLADYQAGLITIRQTIRSMTGSDRPIGLSESQVASLANQRLTVVGNAASSFLSALSNESSARLDAVLARRPSR